jgi:hypothetical protein
VESKGFWRRSIHSEFRVWWLRLSSGILWNSKTQHFGNWSLKRPNRVGVSLPSTDRSIFRNIVFASCSESRTMDKVHKHNEFRIFLFSYSTSGTLPRVAVVLSGDWLNDIGVGVGVLLAADSQSTSTSGLSSTSLFLPARITRSPSQSSVFCWRHKIALTLIGLEPRLLHPYGYTWLGVDLSGLVPVGVPASTTT